MRLAATWIVLLVAACGAALAQDLAPRAYVIVPVGSNAITLADSFNDGTLLLDGSVPITDATGRLNATSVTYFRALGLFGRSASVLVALPIGYGTFAGEIDGVSQSTERSGLFDASARLSINLVGGPAMTLPEMRAWRRKTIVGVSLKIVAPTGQYDPTQLINLGSNRWSFKPEIGYSGRWGKWAVDAYGAVWLFTENPEFFSNNEWVSGTHTQSQDRIGAVETHLSYDVRPRLWVSLDGNFWYGGRTSVDGVENPDSLQRNSRVGVTGSFPVSKHQSVKLSYADGAYIRFGGDYRIYSAAWQYSWISKREGAP